MDFERLSKPICFRKGSDVSCGALFLRPGGGTADASDLKSEGELNHRVGSNPSPGTRNCHVAREKQLIMPELPEVQILVNQLGPRVERARIQAIEICDPK